MKILVNFVVSATLTIVAFGSSGALAADATCGEQWTNLCLSDGSQSQPVPVHISYGRHGPATTGSLVMNINPPTQVMHRANQQLRLEITLLGYQKPTSFTEKIVTISSTGNPWLSGSAKASDGPNRQITICIPATCMVPGREYKYDVDIQDVGIFDPRVKVEN